MSRAKRGAYTPKHCKYIVTDFAKKEIGEFTMDELVKFFGIKAASIRLHIGKSRIHGLYYVNKKTKS